MTREEFEALVLDTYGIRADYPFEEDFKSAHPKTEFLYVESFGNP